MQLFTPSWVLWWKFGTGAASVSMLAMQSFQRGSTPAAIAYLVQGDIKDNMPAE